MIEVKHLTKIYKTHVRQPNLLKDIFARQFHEKVALYDASFDIGENELVGFIGPNGAGKTTTLKILSGILYPTSGRVRVFNTDPFKKEYAFLRQIAFVMGQRNQLIWDLPSLDSFILQKEIYEIPDKAYHTQVELLSTLLKCTDLLNKPVKTLSLGERMKMELIMGLLHAPRIVFFDEPTIGLDIFSQEVIRDFIKSYQSESKATIILTSHYLEDVKRLAKRLMIINKGSIVYDGSLNNIVEQYSSFKKLSVILTKQINTTEINAVGTPISFNYPKLSFRDKKQELPDTMKLIMKNIPFSDITIEDASIEEIIKSFFKEHETK